VLGLFTAFSLATLKREPYLTTIVPGIGLMIGYYYHRLFSSAEDSAAMAPLLRVLLGVLAVTFAAGMFFGAAPLRRRWLVSTAVVSPMFIVTIVSLAGLLLYAVLRSRVRLALGLVGALAVAYVVLVVNYVFPAIDQAASPRKAVEEIKTLALGTQPALFMYIPGWPKNEDALYYLKRDNVVPDLPSQDAVLEAVRTHGAIRVVTEEQHAAALQAQAGLVVGNASGVSTTRSQTSVPAFCAGADLSSGAVSGASDEPFNAKAASVSCSDPSALLHSATGPRSRLCSSPPRFRAPHSGYSRLSCSGLAGKLSACPRAGKG
jgi:hypothetical protein